MRSDGVTCHKLSIEVRDSEGPVMEAELWFEIDRKQ